MDLVFVLASSRQPEKQKELTRRLVQNYVISLEATNVALVSYDPVYTSLQFNKGTSSDKVLTTLQQMKINDGSAVGSVSRALDYLSESVFTRAQGTRQGATKKAIFLVDSDIEFSGNPIVKKNIDKLKSLGINSIFIQVGNFDGGNADANKNIGPTKNSPDNWNNVFFFPDDLESGFDQFVDSIVSAIDKGMSSFVVNYFISFFLILTRIWFA